MKQDTNPFSSINSNFVKRFKNQLLEEFRFQDKNGIYGFLQKTMAYNSNKIEGSAFTSKQTTFLFDTGTVILEKNEYCRAKDIEEASGHFIMFNEVLKNLDKQLTVDMIKAFHFQLKAGVFEDRANGYPIGEFKNRRNIVGNITTELPENVLTRIEHLVRTYNSSNQELEDIVRFHANYERIHPFQDGNGRTGRAIVLKQCLDSNILPVLIDDSDKLYYYEALYAIENTGSYEMLLEFFRKEQAKYYEIISSFIAP